MRRRDFIGLLGAIAGGWTCAKTVAARTLPMARIGILVVGTPPIEWMNVLKAGLDALGWREGETLEIEKRSGSDQAGLARPANELVALRPDVLIAVGSSEAKALQAATSDIPIVFLLSSDPIGMGIVDSIARPGKNITGIAIGPQILWGKRLELIVELLGHQPRKVAWLGNPGNVSTELNLAAVNQSAEKMGIKLEHLDAREQGDLDGVFATAAGVALHLIVRMRSFRPWWAFNCENPEVWDSQINCNCEGTGD